MAVWQVIPWDLQTLIKVEDNIPRYFAPHFQALYLRLEGEILPSEMKGNKDMSCDIIKYYI